MNPGHFAIDYQSYLFLISVIAETIGALDFVAQQGQVPLSEGQIEAIRLLTGLLRQVQNTLSDAEPIPP